MQASVINVGSELLSGQTTNTNLSYIARRLRRLGIVIARSTTVSDTEAAIHEALAMVQEDVLIITGGLGPSRDDITKESLASFFGWRLVKDERVYEAIRRYFESRGRTMRETNEKQARFPPGATVLKNQRGTAPGMVVEHGGRTIVALPGPPGELKGMFPQVEALLKKRRDDVPYQDGFLLVGRGESEFESDLQDLYTEHPDVELAPYASLGEIRYILLSHSKESLKQAKEAFRERLHKDILGRADDTLEGLLVAGLRQRSASVAFAESCTGGLVASRVVDVPGASDVFEEGYVLYSNASKSRRLGVSPQVLENYGAVSEQCAYEMAYLLQRKARTDYALSVTGIAGPEGGSEKKPVGTVYFGLAKAETTRTFHRIFSGDRQMIRRKASAYALSLLIRELQRHEA